MKANSIEHKMDKRERIIDAASKLFSSKKYHEVMMEDIAKSASIAKGTLYNYFNSKDDLYFSIMLTRMENLFNSLDEKITSRRNPVEALHSFIIHNYMFMMKYPCFFKMYQRDNVDVASENAESLRKKKRNLRKLLIEIIESGVKSNVFNTLSTGFAADIILGNIYSAVERGIRKNLTRPALEDEREKVFKFILKGITNENLSSLAGKRILVTRHKDDLKEIEILDLFGVQLIPFPVINIAPIKDWSKFDKAISQSKNIDYIIFTSSNAVELFHKRCSEIKADLNYENIKIAVTGSSTAEDCKEFNIPVDIIPADYSAQGLLKMFAEISLNGKNVLIPGSKISRKELPEGLERLGAKVNIVPTYSVEIPDYKSIQENLQKITNSKPDIFVFTSPSSFKNFIHILNLTHPAGYFANSVIAAIGPSTKNEIELSNVEVSILPDEHTMNGIFNSIIKHNTLKEFVQE